MTRYAPLVFYVLLSAFAQADELYDPVGTPVNPQLVERMLVTAEKLTGRTRGPKPVQVTVVPEAYFCLSVGRLPPCGVWGAYFNNNEIKLNAATVNTAAPIGRATLLHELVHYLQDADGKGPEMDCYESEREAYAAEKKWLESFGFKTTFGFEMPDEFTLKVRCVGEGY